jgi:hypothetical protein
MSVAILQMVVAVGTSLVAAGESFVEPLNSPAPDDMPNSEVARDQEGSLPCQ